jgi:hypothetical protein
MATLSERWTTEGAIWELILKQLEPIVQKQAKEHAVEAKRDRWDVPGFHYQWNGASAIGHLIQVLVVGAMGAYELDFGGTAWKDDPSSRKRKWRSQGEQRVQVPQDPDTLDLRAVEARLKALDKTVSGWSESDLTKEADLPPRPEHLKDAFPKFQGP